MISLILVLIASIFDAARDTITHKKSNSIFRNCSDWWDPAVSWRFKYKNNDPSQGQKFLFSTTMLVFITDSWHLLKALEYTILILAIVFYNANAPLFGLNYIFDFLIYRVASMVSFEFFYTIFRK